MSSRPAGPVRPSPDVRVIGILWNKDITGSALVCAVFFDERSSETRRDRNQYGPPPAVRGFPWIAGLKAICLPIRGKMGIPCSARRMDGFRRDVTLT